MRQVLTFLAALGVALLASTPAEAGPIRWSVSGERVTIPGGFYLDAWGPHVYEGRNGFEPFGRTNYPPTESYSYRVFDQPVTLTDLASGESATLTVGYDLYRGQSHIDLGIVPPGTREVDFGTFDLGANRYTLTVDILLSNYQSVIYVLPESRPVETPEPATACLAGLGCCIVAAARRRRK